MRRRFGWCESVSIGGLGQSRRRLVAAAVAADVIGISFIAQVVKLIIGFSDPPFSGLLSGRNGSFT
jgi:hypothetical protein